jgi:hypothetical protein
MPDDLFSGKNLCYYRVKMICRPILFVSPEKKSFFLFHFILLSICNPCNVQAMEALLKLIRFNSAQDGCCKWLMTYIGDVGVRVYIKLSTQTNKFGCLCVVYVVCVVCVVCVVFFLIDQLCMCVQQNDNHTFTYIVLSKSKVKTSKHSKTLNWPLKPLFQICSQNAKSVRFWHNENNYTYVGSCCRRSSFQTFVRSCPCIWRTCDLWILYILGIYAR